jgi:hypothetical protein
VRKEAYIASLDHKPETSLLVSLADKAHNSRAIVADLEAIGDQLWGRFREGPTEVRRYYRSLADVFGRRLPGALANELRRNVAAMHA